MDGEKGQKKINKPSLGMAAENETISSFIVCNYTLGSQWRVSYNNQWDGEWGDGEALLVIDGQGILLSVCSPFCCVLLHTPKNAIFLQPFAWHFIFFYTLREKKRTNDWTDRDDDKNHCFSSGQCCRWSLVGQNSEEGEPQLIISPFEDTEKNNCCCRGALMKKAP